MKISLLVFLVISRALTLAASEATVSNPAPQRLEGAANTASVGKRRVQHRAAKANQVPKPPQAANTNRPKRPGNVQTRSTSATADLQPRSRLSQSVVVEKKGSSQNKSVNSVSAVQRQGMFHSAFPSLDNPRHGGSNPAVLGGLGTSKLGGTGAINGSRIGRKP